MVGFGIDEDENIERIAETTALNTDSIGKLRDSFSEKFLSEGHSAFKLQYLAHLVRSMESYIRRELEDHRFFRIELQPFRYEDPNLGVASAQRSPPNTYIIYYHPAMDPKPLRICLAHELGHLFLCILADKKPEEYRSKESEALSWAFAALAIFDKTDFYLNKEKDFLYEEVHALWAGFRAMINRTEGVLNSS